MTIFKTPLPTHIPCGHHKWMVPYETPTEIVPLNILQNVEIKQSTYRNSMDILVTIHVILFLDKD